MNSNAFLSDALARLYDEGIAACLETCPELAPHRSLLLRMRWQEGELTEREIDAENAAEMLHRMESELIQRLNDRSTLQGYTPRQQLGNAWRAPWTWLSWQAQRTLSLLSMTIQPQSRSTISGCSSRLAAWEAEPPTASWKKRCESTTAACPEPSTPLVSSTERDGQASDS
jgi:hypothetical protein